MLGNSATKSCECTVGYYSLDQSWSNYTEAHSTMCQECAAIETQQCKESWPLGPCLDGINLGEKTIWESAKACPGGPVAAAYICPLSGLWIEPGNNPPHTLSLIPCEGSYQCEGPEALPKPNCSMEEQVPAHCGPHHTGFLCAHCEPSYTKVAGKCVFCEAVDYVTLGTQILTSMGMGCFLLWKSLKVVPTVSQAKDVFNAMDEDGGGALDRGEIKHLLGAMGDPLYSWNRCLNKHVKKMVGGESFSKAKVLARVKQMFYELADHDSGTLPKEKVHYLLQEMGQKLAKSPTELGAWTEASTFLTKALAEKESASEFQGIRWDEFKDWYEGPSLYKSSEYYDVVGVARSLFDDLDNQREGSLSPKQLDDMLSKLGERVGKKKCCGLRPDRDKKRWQRASREFVEYVNKSLGRVTWEKFTEWYSGEGQRQLNASRFSEYIDKRAIPPLEGELLHPSKRLELEVTLEQFQAWAAISQPSAAMGIFIFFTQTFGLIAQQSEFFGVLDVLNFDVEDALGKCLAPDMPLIMSLALVLLSPVGAGLTVAFVYWMITSSPCCHNVAKSTNKPRLQPHHLKRAFVNVSLFAFAPLTRRCVSLVLCRYVHATDKYYLVENLAVVCYEGHHQLVSMVSVVTLVIYALGLPLFLMSRVKSAIRLDHRNLLKYRTAQLEAHLQALGVETPDTREDVLYELRKLVGKATGVDIEDETAIAEVLISLDDWLALNAVHRGEILTQVARKMSKRTGVAAGEDRAELDRLRLLSREQLDRYLLSLEISDKKAEIIISCLNMHNVYSLDGKPPNLRPSMPPILPTL